MTDDRTTETRSGTPAGAAADTAEASSGPSRLDALRGLAGTMREAASAVAGRLPRPGFPTLKPLKGRVPGKGDEGAASAGRSDGERVTRVPGWAARALDRVPTTGLLALSATVIWGIVFFNYWR